MNVIKFIKNPYIGLCFNFAYAIGNCIIGFISHSLWFIVIGSYYTVLTVNRFSVLKIKQKSLGNVDLELFAMRITGFFLILMSLCLVLVNILSAVKMRGTEFNQIMMITIATYTFAKITIAIIGIAKKPSLSSPITKTLANISLADAVVSINTLQRSMLISFPGMKIGEIRLFNILTGTAVWFIVLILGINLLGGKYINMAKSKIIKANEKISKAVTGGYKKIKKGVVDGYKKIELGVVDGYTKIEDKFIDAYLTKDGETVEQAKLRLKKENKDL